MIVMVIAAVALVGGGIWYTSRKTTLPEVMVTKTPTPESKIIVNDTPVAISPGEIRKFTIEGGNFKFTPNTMKIKKGDTVQITFKNSEGNHDFVIDEFEVATNKIGEGEEEEVEFVADKVGTFEFYCSVGNHRAMGMKGSLIVE